MATSTFTQLLSSEDRTHVVCPYHLLICFYFVGVCASVHACFLMHHVVFFVLLAVLVFWVDNQNIP